jgi:hypothetical protein
MATLHRKLRLALILGACSSASFSDAAAPAQVRADLPSSATLTLRVAPATAGATLTTPGGTVRLLLAMTPDSRTEVSPAQPRGRSPAPEAILLAGPAGPALVWASRAANPTGFTVAALLSQTQPVHPYSDRAARNIHWPIKGWPAGVASTLHPDAHADELNNDVRRLVEGWLGAQTRAVTPAVLAKYLAARTLSHARADLEPMAVLSETDGQLVGLRSTGVAGFARNGAGSELDMLRTYNAALRIAGIPSRLVTGVRAPAGGEPSLHSWVEFYLYDERARQGEWVAVDLAAQRWLDPEPPAIADSWRRFGENDARLFPLLVGVPPASLKDSTLLTPWSVECDPPCAPLRVTVSVSKADPAVAQR